MATELTIWEVEDNADNDMMPFCGILKGGRMSSIRHPSPEIRELAQACATNEFEFWDFDRNSVETKKFIEEYKKELIEWLSHYKDADGEGAVRQLDEILNDNKRLLISIG